MEAWPPWSTVAAGLRPKAAARPHAKSAASRLRQGSHGWLVRQAERLDAARERARANRAAAEAAGVPARQNTLEDQRREHRTTTGLAAAGFNVGRHVQYVLGRPTIVPLQAVEAP